MLALLLVSLLVSSSIQVSVPAQEELERRVVGRVLECDNDAQLTALLSTAPEFAYMGRRFGGKSWIGDRKALEYGVRYGSDERYSKPRIGVSREERASMEATTLASMRDDIVGPELWSMMYRASLDEMWLPNGAVIRFFGLDKPGRALGARYGFMFVDQAEQLSNEQFNIAISCCTQPGLPWTQFFTAYNPENPEHWAFKRYRPDLGNGPRSDEDGHFADVVLVGEDDLLHYLNASDVTRLERLEGVWRDRLRFGRWVAFTGVVYEGWSPAAHIIEPPEVCRRWSQPELNLWVPPPSWRRVRGVDFGYNPDPYVMLWIAIDPEGRWHVYRQDYRLGVDSNEQAERIKAVDAAEEAVLRLAPERRADQDERDDMRAEVDDLLEFGLSRKTYAEHDADTRAIYRKAGIQSVPARKEIHAGLESVRLRLSPSQPGGPRLFFWRDNLVERDRALQSAGRPTCTEEEFGRYIWKVAKTAAGATSIKDVPVDENNHGMDALRYAVHTHDLRASWT